MKIKNVKINNFGKLENKEIEFEDNINLIYGENESGKSTLLTFISSMFYGASKNKNGKNITDYEKYKPWNNGEFSGKIKYELDNGETFEIFREFDKKNPKIYNEKLEDISKTFNIDKTKGNQFFYDQTKVDEDLFLSTIVSEQKEVQLDEKKQNMLLQKMTNIVGTGEDNTSFNKTINKLNKKLLEEVGTERSTDRPINVTENRIKEIENEKEQIQIYSDAKYNIEEENKQILEKISESENRLKIIQKLKQIREYERIESEKIKVNKNIEEENNKKIEQLQNKLDEIENENTKTIKEQENKIKNRKNKASIILLGIFILLEIAILKLIGNLVGIIAGIIFLIIILISVFLNKNKKNKINQEYKERLEKINQNKSQIINEIAVLEKNNKEYIENTMQIQKQIENSVDDEIKNLKNQNNVTEINKILEDKNINYEFENEQNKLNNLKLNLHKLELEKKSILPKLKNLAMLEEELQEKQERYEELKINSECINLAKEYLQIAYEKMKENVTPKFTKKLSENINKISNGKYKNVKFNDEKGLIVEIENGNYVMAENLSTGTIEQLYLSLRFATIDEISSEKLPIILDETFAYFDKTRLKNVIEFLFKECNNRQVFIFTCSKREKEVLDELKFNYEFIEM